MKRILAIILALTMVLVLAACGGDTNVRGTQSGNTGNQTTPEETTLATEAPEFSLGEVNGLVYENAFIGIGCKLPSDWRFYTDEEIRELNNLTTTMLDEELAEALKNATLVYDMQAISSNQLDSVGVNLEKINPLQLAALDLAENFKALMPAMKSTYEGMGYTGIEYEILKENIDGKEVDALYITASIGTYQMHQMNLCIKCNGYLANISVTAFDYSTMQMLLDSFYLLQ